MRDQVWSQRRKLSSRFALTVKFSQSLYESPVDLSPGKSAVSRLSLVTKTPTFWSSLIVAYEIVQWGEVQYTVIKSFGYCRAYDEVLSISLEIQFRGTGFMSSSQWAVEHVPCAANRIPREFGVLDIHKDGLAFRPMRGC